MTPPSPAPAASPSGKLDICARNRECFPPQRPGASQEIKPPAHVCSLSSMKPELEDCKFKASLDGAAGVCGALQGPSSALGEEMCALEERDYWG